MPYSTKEDFSMTLRFLGRIDGRFHRAKRAIRKLRALGLLRPKSCR
jgi:hypothetical protein